MRKQSFTGISEKSLIHLWNFLIQISILKAPLKGQNLKKYIEKGVFEAAEFIFETISTVTPTNKGL